MQPVISVRHLDHFFGQGRLRRRTLFDVSLDVLPGEIVILTGPSGAGKTTLLTLIGALREVSLGNVTVLNRQLRGALMATKVEVRKQIGFIFQGHNLLDALTACQNVQLSLAGGDGLSPQQARRRCEQMLVAVGLGEYINQTPRRLSGGQKQRVAIARALVRNPRIVLADEPTAALDKKSGREVIDLLHDLAKRQGCAILLVTHDNRILDIADRILTLEDGSLSSYTTGLLANTGHLLAAFAQLQGRGELQRQVNELDDQQFVTLLERTSSDFALVLQAFDLANRKATAALVNELLKALALKIRGLIGAERATAFMVDFANDALRSQFAQAEEESSFEITIPLTRGVAGRVARTGESLNISHPYDHPDFLPDVDRRSGYRTRNLLAVPVRNREGTIFGVLELLNKVGAEAFSDEDEERLQEFGAGIAPVMESCDELNRLERARQQHLSPARQSTATPAA